MPNFNKDIYPTGTLKAVQQATENIIDVVPSEQATDEAGYNPVIGTEELTAEEWVAYLNDKYQCTKDFKTAQRLRLNFLQLLLKEKHKNENLQKELEELNAIHRMDLRVARLDTDNIMDCRRQYHKSRLHASEDDLKTVSVSLKSKFERLVKQQMLLEKRLVQMIERNQEAKIDRDRRLEEEETTADAQEDILYNDHKRKLASFNLHDWLKTVVPEGLQLSIEIKVFLMGRYVCVVQQHGQAMIIEVHLSYLNTEVHQML